MADVKILLVEDESIEALDIKLTLESFGYEVPYVASSGEEVVEKALEIMPDLILMDIVLKGDTDGIDVASKIKDIIAIKIKIILRIFFILHSPYFLINETIKHFIFISSNQRGLKCTTIPLSTLFLVPVSILNT